MTCTCQTSFDGGEVLPGFARVREGCVALRQLLAPAKAWDAIVRDAQAPPNSALHCSYLLAAFQRNLLHRITGPIHRFLCDGDKLLASITRQYRSDLAENWLEESELVARHERFRRFFGKVVELQVADWFATAGWNVQGLEALGATADIVATRNGSGLWAADVKYIGQQTGDFIEIVSALAGDGISVGTRPLYGGINYLLFRAFEGARSLARTNGHKKLVAIAIDALAWPTFEFPLLNSWLDWDNPTFVATDEREWNLFLNAQRTQNPNLDSEVRDLVSSLDGLIVFSQAEYEYSVQFERWAG